ncbi:MAG: S8 family serine peptidase [Planctomycetota bacterium]
MLHFFASRVGRGLLLAVLFAGLAGWWPGGLLRSVPEAALAQIDNAVQDRTPPPARPVRKNIREVIGYEAAYDRLGRNMPSGRGIAFAHVEGGLGNYRPQLEGPAYDAVAFTLRSGESNPNGHATQTARIIYGSTGLAPGVEVVHCMTTADFLGKLVLNAGTTGPPVAADDSPFAPRVFTHSWIGEPGDMQAAMILRRVDHLVDTRDVIMVAGVNNGRDTPVPALLGSAYNAIAVGTTSGKSSGGVTSVDLPGRSKPDLVAPHGMTSFTTPVVSAAAALLLEQADRLVEQDHADANRAEVIKAALLSGATKPAGWQPLPDQPLDSHLGAGVVHVDRSLRILAAGPAKPGEEIKRLAGWSFPTVKKNGVVNYTLKLPVDTGPASFTLTWHRRIDGRVAIGKRKDTGEQVAVWLDGPRLADLDLRLVSLIDGQAIDLAQSTSRVDNVEHIYLPSLAKGEYRLEILRDPAHETLNEDWQAALAWVIDKPVNR